MPADAVNSTSFSPLGNIREASNLTELQLLYWVGHQLRPSAAHFNNAFAFTFTTTLDLHLFQQAFAIAVAEHDVLRTIFHEQDGIPQQQVLGQPPSALELVDLSTEPDLAKRPEHGSRRVCSGRFSSPTACTMRPCSS